MKQFGWILLIGLQCSITLSSTKNNNAQRYSIKIPSAETVGKNKQQLLKSLKQTDLRDGWLDSVFADSRLKFDTSIFVLPSDTNKPCRSYLKPCFGLLSDSSLIRGKLFYEHNKSYFDSGKAWYGVEPFEILGIFRIESYFGKHTGHRPVINSLFTLYQLPKWKKFAKKELTRWLVLCSENEWDPFEIQGSWAGAFGLCQFIPTSFILFGVDGDGDGRIDLFNEPDAIMSTANYLSTHGYGASSKSRLRAAKSYNPGDKEYGKAVIAYAKKFRKRFNY